MKYILEVDSRTDLTQSAEHKHKLFVEFLNGLGGFWGLKNDAIPFPGFGNDTSAIIQIEKFLSLGIDFTLFYTYRNLLGITPFTMIGYILSLIRRRSI